MNENELQKKNKEITELKNTIKDLNNKLSESESLKSNFISNIMNEVYNPFSSIISMADNIISLKENNLEKAIPMAEIIYREAAQLDFHLQNIFSAATIEAGLEFLEVSTVNIALLFESALKKFHFDIENKGLIIKSNIEGDSKISLNTDSKKLSLLLLNLISNSIKYSPEGGEITLGFELIENQLNILVHNQGSGISESELKLIYDRFKRVDITINSVTGGSGLGLSVVKALTELMEGNIKITNDNGTKVLVCIPNLEIVGGGDIFEDDAILFDEEVF